MYEADPMTRLMRIPPMHCERRARGVRLRLASLHLHETEWIMSSMESCKLAVRLIPRARVNEIAGDRDGVLLVRVTAPPVDGKANAALCRLIAKRAGVGVRSVSVVRGAGSRDKLVHVDGISAEDLRRALT